MYCRFALLPFAILSLHATEPVSSADAISSLAERGHCTEALPQLRKALPAIKDAQSKRRAGVAGVRCSMTLGHSVDATFYLDYLSREFPNDAAVLYLASHVFSDLSIRASNELLRTNPGSAQVHQLNAEALETQGKWKEAEEEYRAVLKKDPNLPGIHYRLGRLLLSLPATPTSKQEAQAEFEQELKVNPANAGAEFVLGELARQASQLPDAVSHFRRATELDNSFVEAYAGLGRALLESQDAAGAIAPLETAVKLQPQVAPLHFYLGTAYNRAGRKADADREFAAHKLASERDRAMQDAVQTGVQGLPQTKP